MARKSLYRDTISATNLPHPAAYRVIRRPMLEFLQNLHPILQAVAGTGFTWLMTAAGAATVFLSRSLNRKVLDAMLGFAAGVVIAASYWSLLAPAHELAAEGDLPAYVPAVTGFLLGGALLRGMDLILPHLHLRPDEEEQQLREGMETTWQRTTLSVLAITLHNIPEGLAVGVAFGAAAAGKSAATVAGAVALTIGIGIQNFPEAVAVSIVTGPREYGYRDHGRYRGIRCNDGA